MPELQPHGAQDLAIIRHYPAARPRLLVPTAGRHRPRELRTLEHLPPHRLQQHHLPHVLHQAVRAVRSPNQEDLVLSRLRLFSPRPYRDHSRDEESTDWSDQTPTVQS